MRGKRPIVRALYAAFIGAAAILTAQASDAAVTSRDMQVAGRILALTSNPLSGDVRVGIVYDPDNPTSMQDERALKAILSGGLTVGDVNLIPVPVRIDRIGKIPTNILFLTTGLGAKAGLAGDQAAREKILCITPDPAATQAGFCALSLQVDAKVHITVNHAALAASDVSFTEAFMLMIHEI
jgi:hypothetical protein